ncbi:reverse transcriptase domain-containing protein [Tanacetum coccineum]
MDDELMWAADRVVAPTPGSAITIPKTANEFAIKVNHLTIIKGNQFDGRTKTDPHKHINEFLGICDMFKYRDTENEAVRLMMFPISLTKEAKTWLDELNEGTIKTSLLSNTQPNPKGSSSKPYQPSQARNKHVNAVFTRSAKSCYPLDNLNDQQNDSETPINFDTKNMLVEVGKFTFPADFVILEMEEDNKVPLILGRPFLHTADAVIRVKQKQLNLEVGTE